MAMGKRRRRGRQRLMWVASSDLPRSAGHPFYERLNGVLDEAGFDAFVEEQCAKCGLLGASQLIRRSVAPIWRPSPWQSHNPWFHPAKG